MTISGALLKRLQTLYGQMAAHTLEANTREARLEWASAQLGRSVASFSALTREEASSLIDGIQGQLGLKLSRPRPALSRGAAHAAGTEGRRGNQVAASTMVSAADMARIQHALDLLGWDRPRLDEFLRSSRSPLGKRSSPEIRTLGDANRVWWALKRIARRQGAWKDTYRTSICPSCGRTDRTEFANCSNEWHREGVKIAKESVLHG